MQPVQAGQDVLAAFGIKLSAVVSRVEVAVLAPGDPTDLGVRPAHRGDRLAAAERARQRREQLRLLGLLGLLAGHQPLRERRVGSVQPLDGRAVRLHGQDVRGRAQQREHLVEAVVLGRETAQQDQRLLLHRRRGPRPWSRSNAATRPRTAAGTGHPVREGPCRPGDSSPREEHLSTRAKRAELPMNAARTCGRRRSSGTSAAPS